MTVSSVGFGAVLVSCGHRPWEFSYAGASRNNALLGGWYRHLKVCRFIRFRSGYAARLAGLTGRRGALDFGVTR